MKTAGQKLFEQWCQDAYTWNALPEIAQQRWEWLAANFEKQKLDAINEGKRLAAEIIHNKPVPFKALESTRLLEHAILSSITETEN